MRFAREEVRRGPCVRVESSVFWQGWPVLMVSGVRGGSAAQGTIPVGEKEQITNPASARHPLSEQVEAAAP